MLIRNCGKHVQKTPVCMICGQSLLSTGQSIGVCPQCIRDRWEESRERLSRLHAASREPFNLPTVPPAREGGLPCNLCSHECRMGIGDKGYCGVREGSRSSVRQDGRSQGQASSYLDPLPTNCVADWVCAGGTGAGFPRFAYDEGPEVGYYNLAVFFESCNFDCLYCQNWPFKKSNLSRPKWRSVDSLVREADALTSCVCFFGGDPTPQLPFALRVAREMRRRQREPILRICWETNLSMHPVWLKRMARVSLESGGCIKADLKAWNPRVHEALCGCGNELVLQNFRDLSRIWVPLRPDPPFLIASTVLVPGYVDEEEIFRIASFIASLDVDIPYALLAFAPQFCMEDSPTTSRIQAEACLSAAKAAGVKRVRLANRFLLH